MAKKPGAGNLYYKVGLQKQTTANPDSPADYGNTVDVWDEQFECRAEFRHLRGNEEILAARLQGTHIQVITVRSSTETRQITTDWRVVDKRTSEEFNIRDVTAETNRQFISLLCEKGIAT